MDVIIRDTAEDAARLTARVIADAIRLKPNLVLGLATGRTMERVYGYLVEEHRRHDLSFRLVTTFNLDEYVGLPPSDAHSYHHYMHEHLFQHVDINEHHCHLPNGMAEDLDEACQDYESKIRQCGGIDLQLLGIGRTGHIGFNEPLSALMSRTRPKALTPDTVEQNSPLFRNGAAMPRRALTMGVGTILESKRCVLLATGEEKADVIARAVEGPITSMISATALQLHAHCTVIVDEAAASRLENKDYYHWLLENEPEWDHYREG